MNILLLKKLSQLSAKVELFNPKNFGNHVTHNYGNTENSVCMGNDIRLYNDRNPLPHSHLLPELPIDLVTNSLQIIAGSGLAGGGNLTNNVSLSHADTSSQESVVTVAENVFIKSIQLDTFGHITAINTGNVIDLNNYVTGISGTGNSILTIDRQGLNSLSLNLAHAHDWLSITNKPTTISGYSISDAYTKAQIDAKLLELPSGIRIQDPVVVATTNNITLSGLQTIDGISLISGSRVLVKNQIDKTQNGAYIASASSWVRTLELNESSEIDHGYYYFVESGTINGSTGWMLSLPEGTTSILGTTEIEFRQFFDSPDYTVGVGLLKIGNQFSVDFSAIPTKAHTHDITDLVSGTLSVSRGGTGKTTFVSGEVLIGSGTGPITTVSRNGIDTRLVFTPSAHTHNTTDIIIGTLPVSRGGTGLSALTTDSVLVGNGTSAVSLVSRSGIDTRASFTPSAHNHDGVHITTGTIAEARLPLTSDRLRKITISTAAPSGGSDGDIWFKVY